jgi:putative endonuclease
MACKRSRVRIPLAPFISGVDIMVTVYVLQGRKKCYVGIINNLTRRLREHRSKRTKGGQIIKDFALFYTEQCSDYASARKREKFLKSGAGRELIDHLKRRSRVISGG